ncbi:MAG: dephospho-CoA kinase [Castellaniella sp.]|uniref:dephospho-CoA kinase n=1 Tax=Castellaniella sp. TaxID=1955812 RepID=UPI003A89FA15
MFSIGLTGGIGSGKSKVADWLAEWGASVVDTDRIAHALTAPGGGAVAPLRTAFGAAAIGPDGALDRGWMRERAFADPAARQQLESVLHPLIDRAVRDEAGQARGRYLVFVVPLLVESAGKWRDRVDRICVVDCDPETQMRRVQARSGLTHDTIERIMSAQASREDRLAVADDVIVNDDATGLETLRRRVFRLHQAWSDHASGLADGRTTHG